MLIKLYIFGKKKLRVREDEHNIGYGFGLFLVQSF
jgi:hypothetical protein